MVGHYGTNQQKLVGHVPGPIYSTIPVSKKSNQMLKQFLSKERKKEIIKSLIKGKCVQIGECANFV